MPNNVPWYQTSLWSAIIGAICGAAITGIVSLIVFYMTNKYNEKNRRRELLITTVQTNSKLFNLIYIGAIKSDGIDYGLLRTELMSTSILFLLPSDLKIYFEELYNIYCKDPNYIAKNKDKIHINLVKIKNKLEEYGVEVFGT